MKFLYRTRIFLWGVACFAIAVALSANVLPAFISLSWFDRANLPNSEIERVVVSDDHIYIGEDWLNRVQVYSLEGKFERGFFLKYYPSLMRFVILNEELLDCRGADVIDHYQLDGRYLGRYATSESRARCDESQIEGKILNDTTTISNIEIIERISSDQVKFRSQNSRSNFVEPSNPFFAFVFSLLNLGNLVLVALIAINYILGYILERNR